MNASTPQMSWTSLTEKVTYDEAFQAALQRYTHGNGSSMAIATAALRAAGVSERQEKPAPQHLIAQAAAHTPGPWRLSEDPNENLFGDAISIDILDANDFPIATVEANPIIHGWAKKFPGMAHWADGADDGRTQIERRPEEVAANAHTIAAAPALLAELIAAHQIIRNALNVMPIAQKFEWGAKNVDDSVDGEGITRANEREAVIARAMGLGVRL